jgi:hypothetical protein
MVHDAVIKGLIAPAVNIAVIAHVARSSQSARLFPSILCKNLFAVLGRSPFLVPFYQSLDYRIMNTAMLTAGADDPLGLSGNAVWFTSSGNYRP